MTQPPASDLPGFDAPVALLHACHTTILEHCERLERLVAAARDEGDPAQMTP